jgi:hypothetical protein
MNQSPTTPSVDKSAPAATPVSAQHKAADAAPIQVKLHDLAPEIRKQWSKFTDGDLAGVKSQDDLTKKVEMTYAISHDDAKKQVQTWAQGRQF